MPVAPVQRERIMGETPCALPVQHRPCGASVRACLVSPLAYAAAHFFRGGAVQRV